MTPEARRRGKSDACRSATPARVLRPESNDTMPSPFHPRRHPIPVISRTISGLARIAAVVSRRGSAWEERPIPTLRRSRLASLHFSPAFVARAPGHRGWIGVEQQKAGVKCGPGPVGLPSPDRVPRRNALAVITTGRSRNTAPEPVIAALRSRARRIAIPLPEIRVTGEGEARSPIPAPVALAVRRAEWERAQVSGGPRAGCPQPPRATPARHRRARRAG